MFTAGRQNRIAYCIKKIITGLAKPVSYIDIDKKVAAQIIAQVLLNTRLAHTAQKRRFARVPKPKQGHALTALQRGIDAAYNGDRAKEHGRVFERGKGLIGIGKPGLHRFTPYR